MKLFDLPYEVLFKIFELLRYEDIHQSVALVSKQFLRLSRCRLPLKNLTLSIDSNSRPNFKPFLATLHSASSRLKVELHCCNSQVLIDYKTLASAHSALNNTVKAFTKLKHLQVEGSCYKNCDNLVDSFNSLANLKSVEIRFEDNKLDNSRLVENLIAKCSSVGLRNIRILYRDRRMAALSTIQERFGSTLEKLHLEFPDDQSYARVQDNQWEANLTACSRLTHFHIPSYQQAVNAMAAMTNLKVVGVTFNVGNVEFWNSWRSFIFRPVASNTVETLVLEGFPIMANESFWIAWPSESIRKIELSLASDSRDEIVYCLDRISGTFLNLEELVWKEPSTRPLLKTKAPAFWGTRINHAKTDLFFFPNVSKLSLPINREDAIYRYCPYVSQLKFTWNSNVKEEHLLDGMMPDVLKHYGDQIKTIEVEQNPDEKFVIPDMILWRIQDKCRNAKIVIVNL